MKSPTEVIKALVMGLKRELNRSVEERFLKKQDIDIQARIHQLESVLLKERSSLIEAFNSEADPIKRRQILSGIKEIEVILNKHRKLESHIESPASEIE